jgi:hypothetical protein
VRELEPFSRLVEALCERLGAIDGRGDVEPAAVRLQMDGEVGRHVMRCNGMQCNLKGMEWKDASRGSSRWTARWGVM